MHRIHTLLTVILGLALILSLVVLRKSQRELQQQLHTVTDANGALRETLGEMTVAITKKDEEIDRLQLSCRARQELPDSRSVPLPRNPSKSTD
jgi:hypothetical protein